MTHAELVERAARWLQKTLGCSVVVTELSHHSETGEEPDAIGWRDGHSYLAECKASRADFLSDRDKAFRRVSDLGMGDFRYYFAPAGLIAPGELPAGWGLVEVSESGAARTVARSHAPDCPGSSWSPGSHAGRPEFCPAPFAGNHRQERRMLLSLIRRQAGDGVQGRATLRVDPYRIRLPNTGRPFGELPEDATA